MNRRAAARRWLTNLGRTLRPAVLPALTVGVLAGTLCGLAGAFAAAQRPVTYSSNAVFTVAARAPEVDPVSRNATLLSEQTTRLMADGPAERYARAAMPGAEFEAEWVVGPLPDQISFRVTAADPEVARQAAQAAMDRAGYVGRGLRPDDASPLLFAPTDSVTAPARVQKSDLVTTAAPAVAGGGVGALLVLLGATVPERRRGR